MKKINYNKLFINIFLFVSLIVAFRIPFFHDQVPQIINELNVIGIISFFIMLYFKEKISINNFSFFLIGYYMLLIISTIINHNSINGILTEMIVFLSPLIIINSFSKEEFNKCLGTLLFAFEIITYFNFISILIFPNGLYNVGLERKYYFLGHVNIAIRYLLPGNCVSLFYSYTRGNKILRRSWLYILCSILTLIMTSPVTAIIGYISFIIMLVVLNTFQKEKIVVNPFNIFIFGLLITYLVTFIGIQSNFSDIITKIFHKDITFTGRTLIWESAIESIKKQPLFGYGRLHDEMRRDFFRGATSAHNQYLNLLFEGGIASLAYIYFLFYVLKRKIEECKNYKINAIMLAAMFAYALMWNFEPFSYSGTFCMFLIFSIVYKSGSFFYKEESNNQGDMK